jgi:hypothetical protein
LHQQQRSIFAGAIEIQHHLDGADQILDVRPIAQVRGRCRQSRYAAQAPEELQALEPMTHR